MFPLYDWYNLKGQLIRKKILCVKKKPNIPRAEGKREANSQKLRILISQKLSEVTIKGEVVPY